MRRIPLLLLLPLVLPAAAAREDDPARDADEERRAAIRAGIAYLDGHLFRLPEVGGTPKKPFTWATAGLVYLMDARTRTGPARGRPVGRIRDYLVDWVDGVAERAADDEELPSAAGMFSSDRLIQYTWPLAMAGWFFAELEARGIETPASRRALDRAVETLVAAQRPNGGWGHHAFVEPEAGERRTRPDPFGGAGGELAERMRRAGGGYPDTLVASSNVVAITLGLVDARGGRGTGEAVARAHRYFRDAQLDNGSFPYDPSQRSSGFAKINAGRTAGSIVAWHCLGMRRDRGWDDAREYLLDHLEWIPEGHGSPCLNVLHGALACRLLGREPWRAFRATHERAIVARQDEDGALDCICGERAFGVTCDSPKASPFAGKGAGLEAFGASMVEGDRCYNTALHLFVLLLDRDNLRTFDARKPLRAAPVTPR